MFERFTSWAKARGERAVEALGVLTFIAVDNLLAYWIRKKIHKPLDRLESTLARLENLAQAPVGVHTELAPIPANPLVDEKEIETQIGLLERKDLPNRFRRGLRHCLAAAEERALEMQITSPDLPDGWIAMTRVMLARKDRKYLGTIAKNQATAAEKMVLLPMPYLHEYRLRVEVMQRAIDNAFTLLGIKTSKPAAENVGSSPNVNLP